MSSDYLYLEIKVEVFLGLFVLLVIFICLITVLFISSLVEFNWTIDVFCKDVFKVWGVPWKVSTYLLWMFAVNYSWISSKDLLPEYSCEFWVVYSTLIYTTGVLANSNGYGPAFYSLVLYKVLILELNCGLAFISIFAMSELIVL